MFLVTTADEKYWNKEDKILFLGEWCKLFQNKEALFELNFETVAYHWSDKNKFQRDYEFLELTYEKYLANLSEKLNQIHGVNYTERYWRIIIGIWLRAFIDALYDRYLSICQASETSLVTNTWICNTEPRIQNDYPSFAHDEYNHYLYSRIIEFLKIMPYEKIEVDSKEQIRTTKTSTPSLLTKTLNEAKRQFSKGLTTLISQAIAVLLVQVWPWILKRSKNRIVFVGNIYLAPLNIIKLQIGLGQIPFIYQGRKLRLPSKPFDKEMRRKLEFSTHGNKFEKVLNSIIVDQMPTLYLENYKFIHDKVMSFSPTAPKVIFTAFTINYRRFFEFWAAYNAERNGTKLILSQHGGGYGIAKHISLENHFIKCFDEYLTWGSTLNDNPKSDGLHP